MTGSYVRTAGGTAVRIFDQAGDYAALYDADGNRWEVAAGAWEDWPGALGDPIPAARWEDTEDTGGGASSGTAEQTGDGWLEVVTGPNGSFDSTDGVLIRTLDDFDFEQGVTFRLRWQSTGGVTGGGLNVAFTMLDDGVMNPYDIYPEDANYLAIDIFNQTITLYDAFEGADGNQLRPGVSAASAGLTAIAPDVEWDFELLKEADDIQVRVWDTGDTRPSTATIHCTTGNALNLGIRHTATVGALRLGLGQASSANVGVDYGPIEATVDGTPPPPDTVPDAPASATATAGDGEVDVDWTAPGDDGGASITGYRIERNAAGAGWVLLTTTGVVLTHTDSTVTNDIEYQYRVAAINSEGTGAFTTTLAVTPSDTPPPSGVWEDWPGAANAAVDPARWETAIGANATFEQTGAGEAHLEYGGVGSFSNDDRVVAMSDVEFTDDPITWNIRWGDGGSLGLSLQVAIDPATRSLATSNYLPADCVYVSITSFNLTVYDRASGSSTQVAQLGYWESTLADPQEGDLWTIELSWADSTTIELRAWLTDSGSRPGTADKTGTVTRSTGAIGFGVGLSDATGTASVWLGEIDGTPS